MAKKNEGTNGPKLWSEHFVAIFIWRGHGWHTQEQTYTLTCKIERIAGSLQVLLF